MAEEIKINELAVEEDSAAIEGAAEYFEEDMLVPSDTKTTILANENGKEAFGKSQKLIASFGIALEQEVSNIRDVGAAFQEYDAMMGELWESGRRYPVITTMD